MLPVDIERLYDIASLTKVVPRQRWWPAIRKRLSVPLGSRSNGRALLAGMDHRRDPAKDLEWRHRVTVRIFLTQHDSHRSRLLADFQEQARNAD